MRARAITSLRYIGALGLLMTSALLGPHTAKAHTPGSSLTTVRFGYLPITSLLGMYAAIERGYFGREGIRVDLVPMAGGAIVTQALQGGSIDMGESNPVTMLLAASHGVQTVIVARGTSDRRNHPIDSLLVSKDSPIRSAKDLEGKTVAVNTLNNVNHIGMEEWLRQNGADASKVRFTEIGFPDMLASLSHGQIDAAYEAEPYITIGKSLGMRVLAHPLADLREHTLISGRVALRSWAVSHKGLLARFVSAMDRGQQWVDGHHRQARPYLVKYVKMSPDVAKKVPLPSIARVRPSDFTYWMLLCIDWHVLDHSLNVNKLIWPTAQR